MLASSEAISGSRPSLRRPTRPRFRRSSTDEADMGCAVIDMGGGTTSGRVFASGHLVHTDAVAVGGHHVTMDIARGLTTRVSRPSG
jgi:cell division protein FtsA